MVILGGMLGRVPAVNQAEPAGASLVKLMKGPGLAGEVPYICYRYPHFFLDLPGDALFKGFSGLHKSGQYTIIFGFKSHIICQQDLIVFYYRYDNGR